MLRARILLALAGGFLHACAFPPLGWWPLVFVAPVLLLRALRGAGPKDALLAGLAWGASGLAFPARWAVATALARGEGLPLAVLALAALAASPALFALIHAVSREHGARAQIVAPFSWVAIEWLRSLVPLVPCSWFTLAHALGDGAARPFAQAASIGGAASLSLLAISSSLLVEHGLSLLHERRSRAAMLVVLGLGAPVIVWQCGFQVLVSAVPVEAQLPGALLAVVVQDAGAAEAKLLYTIEGLKEARRDFTPDVDLVLWPEEGWPRDPFEKGSLETPLANVAHRLRRALVLGCPRRAERRVLALSPSGRELGGRGEGQVPAVIDVGAERLGLVLGGEISRGDAFRDAVRQGATFFLVPATDPPSWPEEARLQGALHAGLRACETRRPILRASSAGPSFGIDELGRPYSLLAESMSGAFLVRLSGNGQETLYVRFGFFLPRLAALVVLAWATFLAFQPRRSRNAAAAASAAL